jgi:hypothetical protein
VLQIEVPLKISEIGLRLVAVMRRQKSKFGADIVVLLRRQSLGVLTGPASDKSDIIDSFLFLFLHSLLLASHSDLMPQNTVLSLFNLSLHCKVVSLFN